MRYLGFAFGLSLMAASLATAMPSRACESGHWIQEVLSDGEVIKLEDGSLWEVDAGDQSTAALWLPVTDVVVCSGKIINTEDNESIEARRLK